MTKQEAIKYHRLMWNWIAEQLKNADEVQGIYELKGDAIKKFNIPRCVHNCPCCEYSYRQANDICYEKCLHCPIDWGSEVDVYMCVDKNIENDGNGLYRCFCDYETPSQEQYELALKIANLPERKDDK